MDKSISTQVKVKNGGSMNTKGKGRNEIKQKKTQNLSKISSSFYVCPILSKIY